jgi:hypothetical protein
MPFKNAADKAEIDSRQRLLYDVIESVVTDPEVNGYHWSVLAAFGVLLSVA